MDAVNECIQNLENAIKSGSEKARYELVDYILSNKVEEYYSRALQLSSGNDPRSLANLGRLCRYGYGLDKDLNRAVEFYTKASNGGLAWARNELSDTLLERNAPGDVKSALDILQKHADEGDGWAKIRLARMHRDGNHVEKDVLKSFDLFKEAYSCGINRAYVEANDMVREELLATTGSDINVDLPSVVKQVGRMKELRDIGCELSDRLLSGYLSLDPTSDNIVRLWQSDLSSEDPSIVKKALDELDLVTVKGSRRAANILSEYYKSEGNVDCSLMYLKLSLKTDTGKDVNALIDALLSRGKPDDLYDAYHYAKTASDAGDAWSTWRLAKMYLAGQYVEKNESVARELLKIAADKGVGPAKDKLNTM